MNFEMQYLFWNKIDSICMEGERIYDIPDYDGSGIAKGEIHHEGLTMKAWFGCHGDGKPKLLITLDCGHTENYILVETSRDECTLLVNDYQAKGISVEIIDREGNSYAQNSGNEIFVKSCDIYRESFNKTNQLIAILDKEMNLRYANKTLLAYLDTTMDAIVGTPYWELALWSHSTELQNKIVFSLEQIHMGQDVKFETTHKDNQGRLRDIDFVIKPIMDGNCEVELLIAMGYDVTETKLAESALKRTEKEMKLFFDYSVNGYFINRLSESVFLDPEALDVIFSYVRRHEKIATYNNAILHHIDIPATTFENTNLFDLLHISKEESLRMWREMVLEGSVDYQADIEIGGVRKILDCNFVPILEDGNRYSGSFGIIKDVTNEVLQERKMIYLATKDSLTGANNRRHFLESAWEAMHNLTKDDAVSPAVIMIDIDDFKNVNDTYGHDIGDKVLIEMTTLCEDILDGNGIFGRMGGEEFAAFIYNDKGDGVATAEKLRCGIEGLSIKSELGKFQFTVSIGYTEVQRGHTMEEALKRADKALYKAKRSGKNRVEIILS
ncbi:MAG: diguanylate cyclase [Clostridia bacterium]|nr:diguanylate cyclase [Clostridia bacterium]